MASRLICTPNFAVQFIIAFSQSTFLHFKCQRSSHTAKKTQNKNASQNRTCKQTFCPFSLFPSVKFSTTTLNQSRSQSKISPWANLSVFKVVIVVHITSLDYNFKHGRFIFLYIAVLICKTA